MNDPLERNIAALLRETALTPRSKAARKRFLEAVEPRPWPLAAAAAVLLAATLAAVFGRLERPAPDVAPLRAPAGEAVVVALSSDSTIALKARLPAAGARPPILRLEGTAGLPDRAVLFLAATRDLESFDGRRLQAQAETLMGGYAQVRAGRITFDLVWPGPSDILLRATLDDQHQGPELREVLKRSHPVREWSFRIRGWDDALLGRLEPAADEIDSASAELKGLICEFQQACLSEERWTREAPRLVAAARALRQRLQTLPARLLLPASGGLLLHAARNLDGDSRYFSWKAGVFEGPITYHADQQKLKTFRGEDWSFPALRRHAEAAPGVAGRELALWIVKDLRRAGPRPALTDLVKAASKRPGVESYAELLAAPGDLDALEAAIRAGP